jgi:hypothetical protein
MSSNSIIKYFWGISDFIVECQLSWGVLKYFQIFFLMKNVIKFNQGTSIYDWNFEEEISRIFIHALNQKNKKMWKSTSEKLHLAKAQSLGTEYFIFDENKS